MSFLNCTEICIVTISMSVAGSKPARAKQGKLGYGIRYNSMAAWQANQCSPRGDVGI